MNECLLDGHPRATVAKILSKVPCHAVGINDDDELQPAQAALKNAKMVMCNVFVNGRQCPAMQVRCFFSLAVSKNAPSHLF